MPGRGADRGAEPAACRWAGNRHRILTSGPPALLAHSGAGWRSGSVGVTAAALEPIGVKPGKDRSMFLALMPWMMYALPVTLPERIVVVVDLRLA